jgi:PAS domain S-box-containing protein
VIFANHGAGGLLVRRVLPLAVALPIASAWIVSAGADAGWYDPRFATALNISAAVTLLTLLIVWAAQQMWHIDQERRTAQHELQLLNVELEEQVTERTAELAGSEERFRSISEAAQDAIVIADETGGISYANRAASELFGYRSDELKDRPLTDLMPEGFRKAHQKGFARFLETKEPVVIGTTVELAGRRKDGSEFPLELSLSTWTSEDRRFFSGYIRDISVRKENERARALHAAIVSWSDDAIYAVDPSGVITSWNTGAERLYGYTAAQAVGRSVAIVCPYGRESETLAKIEQVLRTRSVVREQTEQRTKEGTLVPVSVTISPLADGDDQALGASVIARDISEIHRREAAVAQREASFRMLTESVSDMIVRMDTEGRITYASPSVRRLMGYTPEELMGRTAADFLSAGTEEEIAHLFEEIYAGRTASTQQLVRRRDGSEVWLEATGNPVVADDGTIEAIIWVGRDVSGHMEALARQREIAERQEELNQLKSEFVGIVAHDLKSPMAVIAGFADVLVDHWDTTSDEEKVEFLGRIRESIRRLSDLVDDVLQVARIESGEMAFNVEPIDLALIVRETVREMEEAEPARTINVTLPDVLPPVLGDKERQWRILTNLLTNAIKFSDPGDPVDVVVERIRDDIRVSVIDRGPGIHPEDVSKLFQRFSRVKQAEGQRVKGSGLGLYISRSLVEAQGGRIWVDSKVGEGSAFRYTIPVAGDPL